METQKGVLENEKIKKWLGECRTPNTRRTYENRIVKFLSWYGKSVEEFMGLSPEQLRDIALSFQNTSKESPNSVLSTFAAVNSFLICYDIPTINFKGKKVKPQMDLHSHIFSNGDLQKMFNVGNTKQKALLALSCSLGWEVSAVLELEREQMESLVKRAESEKQRFVYFISQRKKTNVPRLGVLNPTALEWLGKWLNESKDDEPRKRKENKKTVDRPVSEIFDLTPEGVNITLRNLAKDAQIVTSGRVHFHKLRGWVMSGLSRAGFNEFQIKYLMGKAIPMTDQTYLQTLQQEIEERYPQAFERYLNIEHGELPIVEKVVREQANEVETLKKELQSLREVVIQLQTAQTGDIQERVNEKPQPILIVNEQTKKKLEEAKTS